MEARDSASAPFSMALRRALGHGSTVCAQPIAGGHTRRAAASPPLSKFRCKVGGPIYLYRERSYLQPCTSGFRKKNELLPTHDLDVLYHSHVIFIDV